MDAGHLIPDDAPALVAYAVDEVVRAVRAGRSEVILDAGQLAGVGGRIGTY
jgi:hypothetical protein